MNIDVMEMQESHIDSVVKIENETNVNPNSGETFLKELHSPSHISLVYVNNNEIKGFCVGQVIGDELHIYSLVIQENSRRKGFAKKLIVALLGKAKTFGAQKATLEVRVSNFPAISLYESLGFESVGKRKHYYRDNGEDAEIMWLDSIKVART